MFTVYAWLRTIHIAAGFLGLVVFWLPLLARKGGALHVVCGRVFAGSAAVSLSTILLVCGWRLVDPIGSIPSESQPAPEKVAEFVRWLRLIFAFLAALGFYTAVTLILAVLAIRTRQDAAGLNSRGPRALLWSQMVLSLGLIGYAAVEWVGQSDDLLAGVVVSAGLGGLLSGWLDLRSIATLSASPMFWWYKHMEFMLRTGIAFHTAFAVFVLTPLFGRLGDSWWSLVPWVVPPVLGIPAIGLWVRYYRQRFGEKRQPARLNALPSSATLS